jgi:hypothetical protein
MLTFHLSTSRGVDDFRIRNRAASGSTTEMTVASSADEAFEILKTVRLTKRSSGQESARAPFQENVRLLSTL